jgi:hypothetical protein
MSRKTWIYIVACAELCLGTYFMLGFLAWLVKLFFLDPAKTTSPTILIVWAALAAGCFWLYVTAWRKMKEIQKDTLGKTEESKSADGERKEEKTAVYR